MSRKIKIFDTTLRDGEQAPGFSMDLHEKLDIARQLERLNVDIIEAGFACSSKGDFAAVSEVSVAIKNSAVASLSRCVEKDIDSAREALKNAAAPRLHLFIATSERHMRAKLRMTPEQVLENAVKSVTYGKRFFEDVQFSAEDASRSDVEFLCKVFAAVIKAGATTINIPDTVGYMTPTEYYALVKNVIGNCEGAEKVTFAVHCHNDLGMAVANTLGGIAAGASQAEVTLGGIGERAGNAALEEVVMALHTREKSTDASTRVDTRQLYRSTRLLSAVTGMPFQPNKAIIGKNAFAHESGIHQHGVMADRETYEIMTPESVGIPKNSMILGKHSGRHAFIERLEQLDIHLSEEAVNTAFESFKLLADKKKIISDKDIHALTENNSSSEDGPYSLSSFVINSGNTIDATAIIKLKNQDTIVQKVAMGDGPVDAAFKAIDEITGKPFELVNYSLNSVTEGGDALGEALVRVTANGKFYTGRGLSTDIIEASLKAYIAAANKCLAENGDD